MHSVWNTKTNQNMLFVHSRGIMSDKSELKAELERKKQRLAQIREEKKRKEEERKKQAVYLIFRVFSGIKCKNEYVE